MQISATALFCIGLTTLCVGYIFVELLRGKNYFFRNALERNNNYRLDRVIHYIVRWVIINIVFFYLNVWVNGLWKLAKLLNVSWRISSVLGIDSSSILNIQMIVFTIGYFILLLMVMWFIFYIVKYILKMFSGKSKKK